MTYPEPPTGESRDDLPQSRLDALEAKLARMATTVAGLEQRTTSTGTILSRNIAPVDWLTMSADEAQRVRQGLADFVDYLINNHGFDLHLRPCWFEHPPALEELSSLWTARLIAYDTNSDASMPSWWLDVLERSQLRLRKMFVKCRNGHQVAQVATWQTPEDRDRRTRWVRGETLDAFG